MLLITKPQTMRKNEKRKSGLERRDFLKKTSIAGFAATLPGINLLKQDPETISGWYERLADALNKLPNSFPRTKSNIEITLLKKIFLPEEAFLAGFLTGTPEPVSEIAKRAGLSEDDTMNRLKTLQERNFAMGDTAIGVFRLVPFIVGIYESQLNHMDHELAHLFEEYMEEGGIEIMRPQPAIHRVIPAQSAVKTEWILPYDKLRELMMEKKSFRIRDCICRKQQDLIGTRSCTFPLDVEIIFTDNPPPDPLVSPYVTKEEALAVLAKTEEIGLVHTVSNVAAGIYYVCNCCGCCCGIIRGITEFGIENSVAAANYYAVIDPDQCKACGTCVKRCQMNALTQNEDGIALVDLQKCIGCGLCASGCPSNVARIERKAEEEIVNPPKDFSVWEHERLVNRGLSF